MYKHASDGELACRPYLLALFLSVMLGPQVILIC